jgi:hypothetical protein
MKPNDPGRGGAGNETTGCNVTGDGQADHMVGAEILGQLPADAALEDPV